MQKEQIALFDTQGKQVGTKERAAAYRDRDRVGLCFVWVAYTAPDNTVRMLLQTRSRPGDLSRPMSTTAKLPAANSPKKSASNYTPQSWSFSANCTSKTRANTTGATQCSFFISARGRSH